MKRYAALAALTAPIILFAIVHADTVTIGNSLSSGYVCAASSTGLINSSIFQNLANGYIGVNTTTPSELLHIWKASGSFTTIRFDSGLTQGYFFSYDGDSSVNIGSLSNSQLNFKVNNATEGFFDTSNQLNLQESSGQKTIQQNTAPAGAPQESTVSLIRVASSSATTREFTDITDENYNAGDTTQLNGGSDHAVSINVAKQGNGTFRPFIVRFWNQDAGTVASTGLVAFQITASTNNTSSTPTSSLVAAPSSTARIGSSNSALPGCIEMYNGTNTTTIAYAYFAAGALVGTTTKPTFCQ